MEHKFDKQLQTKLNSQTPTTEEIKKEVKKMNKRNEVEQIQQGATPKFTHVIGRRENRPETIRLVDRIRTNCGPEVRKRNKIPTPKDTFKYPKAKHLQKTRDRRY